MRLRCRKFGYVINQERRLEISCFAGRLVY